MLARGAMLDLDAAVWGSLMVPRMAELSRQHPRCVRVNMAFAERAIDARRWDLASEAVDRLTELTPGAGDIIELNERIAESCGDGTALLELLTRRVEREPNSPQARVRLARLLAADGDIVGTTPVEIEVVPAAVTVLVPEEGAESEIAERMIEMVEGLNTTIFVQNSSEFSGRLIDKAFGAVFNQIANSLVDAFCKRADEVFRG